MKFMKLKQIMLGKQKIGLMRSGMPDANRKVKGTLHWVSQAHCLQAEVRLYDRLWKVENPRDEMAAIREAKQADLLSKRRILLFPFLS